MLEMLHSIIIKFPKSFLDEHAQTLFIHLVQCLANDDDNKVRSMTGVVIKNLVEHISPHLLDSIFDFSLSWYMNEKPQVQSLGAQVKNLNHFPTQCVSYVLGIQLVRSWGNKIKICETMDREVLLVKNLVISVTGYC